MAEDLNLAKNYLEAISLITEIKNICPELRLCQIIGNCFDAGDNYYKPDEELVVGLKRQRKVLMTRR